MRCAGPHCGRGRFCPRARAEARREAYVWWGTAVGRQAQCFGQEHVGGGAALQRKPTCVTRSCTGKCVCEHMCIVCSRIPCALDTRARLCQIRPTLSGSTQKSWLFRGRAARTGCTVVLSVQPRQWRLRGIRRGQSLWSWTRGRRVTGRSRCSSMPQTGSFATDQGRPIGDDRCGIRVSVVVAHLALTPKPAFHGHGSFVTSCSQLHISI